jgi:hypothetical protein
MNARTGWVLAGLLALTVSALASEQPEEKSGLRVLSNRARSTMDQPLRTVLRSEEEWKKLSAKAFAVKPAPVPVGVEGAAPKNPVAGVDWSREMVVAIFLGIKPTSGYRVAITEARPVEGKLVVAYTERAPGKGAITLQALTAPYALAVVPKSNLPVEWKRTGPTDEQSAQ